MDGVPKINVVGLVAFPRRDSLLLPVGKDAAQSGSRFGSVQLSHLVVDLSSLESPVGGQALYDRKNQRITWLLSLLRWYGVWVASTKIQSA